MNNSILLLALGLLSTVSLQVEAQTGLECLKCYSGVCGANSTQLAELISSDPKCCDCFGTSESSCQSNPNTTIQQLYNNLPQDQCCSTVSNIVRNVSYVLNTDSSQDVCEDGTYSFHTEQAVAESGNVVIGAGSYIVNHFRFDCAGCIQSMLFQVEDNMLNLENENLTFTTYKAYRNRGSFTSRLYETNNSFSVYLESSDVPNVLRAIPTSDSCVGSSDVLGFTLPSTSQIRIVGISQSSDDKSIQNVTNFGNGQLCNTLEGLIETVPAEDFGFNRYDVLIAVKLASGLPTSEATSTPSGTTTSSSTATVPTVTTRQPSTEVLPLYAIIAIGVGGGVCLLLLVVICTVALCLCRKRHKKTVVLYTQNKKGGVQRVVSTTKSSRMEDISKTGVITVVNEEAEMDECHNYDLPSELLQHTTQCHFYHELEANSKQHSELPNSLSTESYKYMTMNPVENPTGMHPGRLAATGQQLPSITQGDPEAYHDPTELGSSPNSSHIAPNPLYRTGMEANDDLSSYNPPSHYDVPTALIRSQDQSPPPPPFYHELEGPTEIKGHNSTDNIYTETGFGFNDTDVNSHDSFGSRYSLRSTSADTTAEAPFSPTRESTTSESALLPNFYHELEANSRPIIQIAGDERQNSLSRDLEGSYGSHRVYEPGIYVPAGEERQHLAVVTGDKCEAYQVWRQKSYKVSGKKKQFFKESLSYWEPKNAEAELYSQLSDRKYREILRDQVVFSNHLGVGQFGSVSKATWSNLQGSAKKVAVKTLKPTLKQDAKVAFLKEAAIMGQFSHSNVVQLYGVVTVGEPIMIVMELMALGDLDTYLYNNYRPGEMPPPHKKTLLSFSRQVACGMKYLARKHFVHRDLAARNVLVTETLVCKIGDFGMSRNLHDTNYYASRGGTVPIKWTAPEGLNYKKFSTASDVYSYGMVLYEIWSLGLKPLAHIKIQNVSQYVTEGNCQHPPPGCPRKIYDIMVQCWSPEQIDRPTFSEIFEILNGSDTEVLSWSAEDQAYLSNFAMELGAPLSEAKDMFMDLQRRNFVREERIVFKGHLHTDV